MSLHHFLRRPAIRTIPSHHSPSLGKTSYASLTASKSSTPSQPLSSILYVLLYFPSPFKSQNVLSLGTKSCPEPFDLISDLQKQCFHRQVIEDVHFWNESMPFSDRCSSSKASSENKRRLMFLSAVEILRGIGSPRWTADFGIVVG